ENCNAEAQECVLEFADVYLYCATECQLAYEECGELGSVTVTITSPVDGETLNSGDFSIEYFTTDFTIGSSGCDDCDGHLHVFVDDTINFYGDYMVYSEGPIPLSGVPYGEHSITIQLVDPSHSPFDPSIESTVNVTVSMPTPEISVTPDALSLELNEGETGEQTLTISNTGGEPLEVTLSIDDGSTVTDIDGNVYETVEVGEQVWMKENLKVTHYRNGDEIPTGYSNDDWTNLTTGAYAVYNDDSLNADIYGNLYNGYAVEDERGLCPEGWHVPTDQEYTELTDYLGFGAGGKMKE
ncbi:uncharacterized protein METZ01_LOCUS381457, partial [marine metagenome]